jgi:hypothetical protein
VLFCCFAHFVSLFLDKSSRKSEVFDENALSDEDTIDTELIRIINHKYNMRHSRWDAGYEGSLSNDPTSPQSLLSQRLSYHAANRSPMPRRSLENNPFAKTNKWDVNSLR